MANITRWQTHARHLQPTAGWHALRAQLTAQCHQRHFRQDPDAYLADLEERLLQLILPL
ncbi:MAG: hypothetical protein ACOYL5_05765 [Phototrophicaceae bacterium]